MTEHKFHELIGKKIGDSFDGVLLDPACGGEHNLPLFYTSNVSNGTEFCDADILIIKNNKVKVIIEIEESKITPIQIFGKVFAATLTSHYIHKKQPIEMDDQVLFIQILDKSKLKSKTSKEEQGKNIKKAISDILPVNKIKQYELLFGTASNFDSESLIRTIGAFLSK